jgi:hypothetical protein
MLLMNLHAHTVDTPSMSVDEEITSCTDPSITTVRRRVFFFHNVEGRKTVVRFLDNIATISGILATIHSVIRRK